MKTLITGGSGFLAGYLRALVPGADAPSRAELDVTDDCSVVGDYDRVFHLAAQTSPRRAEKDPLETTMVNVNGTRNVLEALKPGAVMVFVSTCHVYGLPRFLPVTEDHPLAPRGVYASSKLAAERVVAERAIVVRPFNFTGLGQPQDLALAEWAEQGRRGQSRIRCGNVGLSRDYLDVRDVAAGVLLLAERGRAGEAYNLCSGVPRKLVDLLRLVSGGEPEPDPARWRQHDAPVLYGSANKAQALGWSPAVPLERTLAQLRSPRDRP